MGKEWYTITGSYQPRNSRLPNLVATEFGNLFFENKRHNCNNCFRSTVVAAAATGPPVSKSSLLGFFGKKWSNERHSNLSSVLYSCKPVCISCRNACTKWSSWRAQRSRPSLGFLSQWCGLECTLNCSRRHFQTPLQWTCTAPERRCAEQRALEVQIRLCISQHQGLHMVRPGVHGEATTSSLVFTAHSAQRRAVAGLYSRGRSPFWP